VNRHRWSFFIGLSPPTAQSTTPSEADATQMAALIESVELDLHPTFKPPKLTLKPTAAGLCVNRVGWGTFEIDAVIKFHKNVGISPIEISHHLNFSQPLTIRQISLNGSSS